MFRALDKVVRSPEAIFASSLLDPDHEATTRPAQVVGIHFFNPELVLELVELSPRNSTSCANVAAHRRSVRWSTASG